MTEREGEERKKARYTVWRTKKTKTEENVPVSETNEILLTGCKTKDKTAEINVAIDKIRTSPIIVAKAGSSGYPTFFVSGPGVV